MREDLKAQYQEILDAHLNGAGELASLQAYDFARKCLREGLAPDDVMAIHLDLLESEPQVEKREQMSVRAQELLLQVIMAFSLSYQQALRELEASNRELESVSRFKSRMLSMVAHDLTNHIIAIKLLTQALSRDCQEPVQHKRLESIKQVVEDEEHLIQNLLDLGRIESGRLEMDVDQLDLLQLIERAVQKARNTTTRHSFTVSGPATLEVMADRGKTQQVLDNLIGNAVKYSPNGGAVEIAVRTEGREAVVEVRDQGLGIPADDLPHVFEPFFRGRASHTDIKGTGLGLAIVSSLVRLQQGRLEVESTVGAGSTFRFTLPLR